MKKRRATVLVVASLIVLWSMFNVIIALVNRFSPNAGTQNERFAEALLIFYGLIVVLVPLFSWLILKLAWFQPIKDDEFHCPECGYNMHGLKVTKCPECGAEFTIDQLKNG
jgi:membrane protease YdiL (CAAX protease family)